MDSDFEESKSPQLEVDCAKLEWNDVAKSLFSIGANVDYVLYIRLISDLER